MKAPHGFENFVPGLENRIWDRKKVFSNEIQIHFSIIAEISYWTNPIYRSYLNTECSKKSNSDLILSEVDGQVQIKI